MVCWKIGLLLVALAVLGDAKLTENQFRNKKNTETTTAADTDASLPQAQWFQQTLDHLNKKNKDTWNQRYYVRNEFYEQEGPAFLFLEGEYEAFPDYINGYTAVEYAKNLKAIMFNLEHRFYGQSRPTSELNLENLKYLSIEQALEDIASFIAGMNSQYKLPEDTRWILMGTSYAANLAAWARAKYPKLVYAAVAYSAPVQPKVNFWEYKDHVQNEIKEYNQNCLDAVKQGQAQLTTAVSKSENLDELKTKFKLCDPIDKSNPQEVVSLLATVALTFCGIIQNENRWSLTLNEACTVMGNNSIGDYIDRYATVSNLALDETGGECLDYSYVEYINDAKKLTWQSSIASGEIQWDYQVCTEFGQFQTSYEKHHLFGDTIPLSFFIKQCTDLFGNKFTEKYINGEVAKTNKVYGGVNSKTTRIAYVNGEDDPWSRLSITSTKVSESPAILVEGESHAICAYGIRDSASNEVKAACKEVEDLITQWSTE